MSSYFPFILSTRMAVLLLVLSACSRNDVALDQDAYIWQRSWRPAVLRAVEESTAHVARWRVLGAEMSADGRLQSVRVDWVALRASGRPVVMVVRIDGQLSFPDEGALLSSIVKMRHEWSAAGIPPMGVEIDHDCATARLAGYAAFLGHLRQVLDDGISLSVTALPTWLDSPDLEGVLTQVDEAVLQVHAVKHPADGLFHRAEARQWIDRFAARSPVPYRVALPTYGSRVDFDRFGNPVGVESEMPRLASAPSSMELVADPDEVAGLLAALRQAPPRGLRGIAWFRLPTEDDRRAWSATTWHAVMAGRPLKPTLTARLQRAEQEGLYDVVLENQGDIDSRWPKIHVGSGCRAADGINGYSQQSSIGGHDFLPKRGGLFSAHSSAVIGWLRCPNEKVQVHVNP